MAGPDWFRRESWSAADQRQFYARLERSRSPFQKAQYVRIQALHLATVDTREAHEAALELLDMLLKRWPESSQLTQAYLQQAHSRYALGDVSGAVESFRNALDSQRVNVGIRTDVSLDFAWLIATQPLNMLFTEALAALDEFPAGPFPVQRYREAAARALIFAATGHEENAKLWAQRALDAAAARESPFRYHRQLGLVRHPDATVYATMESLAA
jgi:tetratricopeptide (TPR) repeat protein